MTGKYRLVYTKQAKKDIKAIQSSGLESKVKELLALLKTDPLTEYPPFKSLVGDYKEAYSRRINIQHRLVYEIFKKEKIVKIISMWNHYK